ncbi:hypothetical protein KEM60_01740 [Austwickia sp. TVS 96-490-7B]|uniref:MarR family winged helix-turn-helix transcriptional regulator n=1 Tax=Austwickia sp. TVS 96-490-7B TaxID=2830843 RepID=UPI001C57C251|nr:MarR family transcriptional regulator [Austwickia sp. TVS 96-490-7B]MBW3085540.1 hypothetical protein [Austwickia sp. TVS 96-490-7B]
MGRSGGDSRDLKVDVTAHAAPEHSEDDVLDDKPRDLDDLARQGLELRLACQLIARRIRYESTPDLIAPHQFAALARLEDGEKAPGEIAELERVSPPSMTRTVTKLVEDGYARRTRHPTDGRVVLIGLTDAGRALLEETRHRRDLWMTSRLGKLSPDEIALVPDVARILTRVAAW